ncbi:MAG TPA: hypothetical protein P5550_11635 [Bacteroidales bacterium]|nr:hypothetical protein [Bacteroidales bacterium]
MDHSEETGYNLCCPKAVPAYNFTPLPRAHGTPFDTDGCAILLRDRETYTIQHITPHPPLNR